MAHTIVHFEIPSDNIERANKFCTDLFGWKMEKVPGPMEYWMFTTGANNNGEQTFSGGVMERKIPSCHEQITIYIAVNSVKEYAKRVEELGGKVIKPKTEVRSYGWFALCMDTENNIFALWEANTK
jgi:uncharacterized protein